MCAACNRPVEQSVDNLLVSMLESGDLGSSCDWFDGVIDDARAKKLIDSWDGGYDADIVLTTKGKKRAYRLAGVAGRMNAVTADDIRRVLGHM